VVCRWILNKPDAADHVDRLAQICGVPDARVTVLAKEIHQHHASTP
jgi:hypothetical protein